MEYVVRIHHVEYDEGGILDMDDPITDLLEDKDRVRDVLIGRAITTYISSQPIVSDYRFG